jgi:hypothetical protein
MIGRSLSGVPIYKKSDKTDCSNYQGISLLSASYKILSNILLSRFSPYVDEISGDQCAFQCNGSISDQIFCIRQTLEKNWEYSETVHQLFIDLKKAYDSVRTEVLYNFLIEFGVPLKLVRPIKMCSRIYNLRQSKLNSNLMNICTLHVLNKVRSDVSDRVLNFNVRVSFIILSFFLATFIIYVTHYKTTFEIEPDKNLLNLI